MADQHSSSLTNICALVLAFTGFSLWTFGDAIIHFLKAYDAAQLAFVFGVCAFLSALLFSPFLGGLRETWSRPKLGLRAVRGLILASSSFCSFLAFANLPLATAYAIIFAVPLAAKILSVFLTGEQIRLRSWLISLLGFTGVLIVVRPGLVPLNIGVVAALGIVCFFSLGYVLGRKIGRENQTLLSMVIFQYGFVTLFSLPFGLAGTLEMPWQDLALCAAIAVLAVSGTLCVSTAYADAPTALVAPVHYVQILWGIALGALLFGEYPDMYTLVGGAVVIGAGLLLIRTSRTMPLCPPQNPPQPLPPKPLKLTTIS